MCVMKVHMRDVDMRDEYYAAKLPHNIVLQLLQTVAHMIQHHNITY